MASFFRSLAENWKLKALAFALAVLLWVVVTAEQVVSDWMAVPLEVQVTDPDFRLLDSEVRDVEVRFSGAYRDFVEVAVRRPPLRLTIPEVTSENARYELNPRMMQMPGQFAVSATDVRPTTVALRFARVDSRLIPVRVRVNDLLGRDWALVDSLRAEPSSIRITGSPQRVAATTEIYTEAVGLIPEDTLFERVVALDTTGFQNLELSARSVRVIGVLDRVIERGFPGVPVSVGSGVRIEPDRVYVLLRGLRRVVQPMGPTSFRVAVAIDSIPADIPPEGLAVPLRADRLPPNVEASIDPSEVVLYRVEQDTVPTTEQPAASEDGAEPADAPDGG